MVAVKPYGRTVKKFLVLKEVKAMPLTSMLPRWRDDLSGIVKNVQSQLESNELFKSLRKLMKESGNK